MKTIRVDDWYDDGIPETVSVKRGEIFFPVDHASRSRGTLWTGKYYLWTEENPDLEFELEADDLLYYDIDSGSKEDKPKINPVWASFELVLHEKKPQPYSPSTERAARHAKIKAALATTQNSDEIDAKIIESIAPQLNEMVKIMWNVIDRLNTAALDAEKGLMAPTALQRYVKNKTNAVMRLISFPGEPDKQTMFDAGLGWDEDTEEGESDE